MSMYEFNTIEKRYHSVWPVVVTVLPARWTVSMYRALTPAAPPPWLRHTVATIAVALPAALLWSAWGFLLCAFGLLWPIGWLWMLPVRVGVKRGSGQYGAIWALSFFAPVTLGVLWIIGLVLAMRDRPTPAPPVR